MSKYTGPGGISGSLPYLEDTTLVNHVLGQAIETTDGRRFRWALAGDTSLVVGNVLQTAVEDTGDQNITPTAAAIGDTSIVTSTTMTVTVNQYAGGYATVTVTPGLGQTFQIAQHAAYTAAAATFTLEDPVQVALTTTSRLDFVPSPYSGVIVNPATATGAVVGVAVNNITNGQYGWIQTWGPCNVLNDAGTITVGTSVAASNGTAGAIEAITGAQAIIGYALTGIAANENGLIYLKIS